MVVFDGIQDLKILNTRHLKTHGFKGKILAIFSTNTMGDAKYAIFTKC